jgi:hypothetical protein
LTSALTSTTASPFSTPSLKSSKYNSFIVCSLVCYAELACCASPSAGGAYTASPTICESARLRYRRADKNMRAGPETRLNNTCG